MSQRGRGSGPHDEDPDGEDAERDGGDFFLPSASRPIAPYDPYRATSGDAAHRATRNVARDDYELTRRSTSRRDTPFLEDDDPLNAEAWQIEGEEIAVFDDEFEGPLPEIEAAPPRRRERRTPSRAGRHEDPAPAERRAPRRSRSTAATARDRLPRGSVTIAMPRAVSGSSLVSDQTALALLAANVAGVLLMALLLGVRLGSMPNPSVLHLDAAGNPDRWGSPGVLWRLPLMAFFLTVMFLAISWFLHPLDRFAARFALGAALIAQLVAWVAVLQHLFGG